MGKVVEWMGGFARKLRREAGAAEPEFKEVAVVAEWLSLPPTATERRSVGDRDRNQTFRVASSVGGFAERAVSTFRLTETL